MIIAEIPSLIHVTSIVTLKSPFSEDKNEKLLKRAPWDTFTPENEEFDILTSHWYSPIKLNFFRIVLESRFGNPDNLCSNGIVS